MTKMRQISIHLYQEKEQEQLYDEAVLEKSRKEKRSLVLERFTHLKCNLQPE